MDDIVKQAMAKWPNVPHCYGWLRLDARGVFRMCDEVAQKNATAGDPIRHTSLLAFIYRNYASDEHGAWFFQNGPQRVYVDLETTPFIARTDTQENFVTQDGTQIAMLDDRDIAACLSQFRLNVVVCSDAELLNWMRQPIDGCGFKIGEDLLPVKFVQSNSVAQQFGFQQKPRLSI
ncbi:MAG: DUF2946 family protein [Burkholderiales bacterium]|nr:DUF2946 family protein [Burkholderiales bacterium]